jgi:hypothetical protein
MQNSTESSHTLHPASTNGDNLYSCCTVIKTKKLALVQSY